jgi:hypothetical protein
MKVLVIGMVDSIHLGKWLSRFTGQNISFDIFPSKEAWDSHTEIKRLLTSKKVAKYRVLERLPKNRIQKLYLLLTKLRVIPLSHIGRTRMLRKVVNETFYDYIHIHEFQSAGYLFLDSKIEREKYGKLIVTNWGSDIYFFENELSHRKKIEELLKIADEYSAECERDYALATKLGFRGKALPVIPTSFDLTIRSQFPSSLPSADERNKLIVKCYGGTFGLGGYSIEVAANFLRTFPGTHILLHSVSRDLLTEAVKLQKDFPFRVEVWTNTEKHSHEAVCAQISQSRIYIGFSRSDGLSTSFLEALLFEAFPIQSNTSCADELVNNGCIADVIEASPQALWKTLSERWNDIEKLNFSTKHNAEWVKERFAEDKFSLKLRSYYD